MFNKKCLKKKIKIDNNTMIFLGILDCLIGTSDDNDKEKIEKQITSDSADPINNHCENPVNNQIEKNSTNDRNDNLNFSNISMASSVKVFFNLETFIESFDQTGQTDNPTACMNPHELVQNVRLSESPQSKSSSRKASIEGNSDKSMENGGPQRNIFKDPLHDVSPTKPDLKTTATKTPSKPNIGAFNFTNDSTSKLVSQHSKQSKNNNEPRDNLLARFKTTTNNGPKVLVIPTEQNINYPVIFPNSEHAQSSSRRKHVKTSENESSFPPARTYSKTPVPTRKPKESKKENSRKIHNKDLIPLRDFRNKRMYLLNLFLIFSFTNSQIIIF